MNFLYDKICCFINKENIYVNKIAGMIFDAY